MLSQDACETTPASIAGRHEVNFMTWSYKGGRVEEARLSVRNQRISGSEGSIVHRRNSQPATVAR